MSALAIFRKNGTQTDNSASDGKQCDNRRDNSGANVIRLAPSAVLSSSSNRPQSGGPSRYGEPPYARQTTQQAQEQAPVQSQAQTQTAYTPAPVVPQASETGHEAGKIYMISIDRVSPNPSQPRKNFEDEAIIRLADSIRRYGILQPLSVRRIRAREPGVPDFELIAGERRLRAARLLGLGEIPCIIIDADEKKSAELAIIENIQRENLNIFEQAGAIASLIDIYSLTQEQVAKQLSTSQSYVANKLRILRLTSKERDLILTHNLTERHARALLKIEDVDKRIKAIEHIAAKELNVSAAEDYVERVLCSDIMSPDAMTNRRKLILKDIRIFYNTIDKALETVKQAGISVVSDRRELDDAVELTIRIPKQYDRFKSA